MLDSEYVPMDASTHSHQEVCIYGGLHNERPSVPKTLILAFSRCQANIDMEVFRRNQSNCLTSISGAPEYMEHPDVASEWQPRSIPNALLSRHAAKSILSTGQAASQQPAPIPSPISYYFLPLPLFLILTARVHPRQRYRPTPLPGPLY